MISCVIHYFIFCVYACHIYYSCSVTRNYHGTPRWLLGIITQKVGTCNYLVILLEHIVNYKIKIEDQLMNITIKPLTDHWCHVVMLYYVLMKFWSLKEATSCDSDISNMTHQTKNLMNLMKLWYTPHQPYRCGKLQYLKKTLHSALSYIACEQVSEIPTFKIW